MSGKVALMVSVALLLSGCGERMSDWERAAVDWEAQAHKAAAEYHGGDAAELERLHEEAVRRSAMLTEFRETREAHRIAWKLVQEAEAQQLNAEADRIDAEAGRISAEADVEGKV